MRYKCKTKHPTLSTKSGWFAIFCLFEREASNGVPVTTSVVVVCCCRGHNLRLGMSGWSSLALGVGNQSNDWWWMIDVSGLSLDCLWTVPGLSLDRLWTVSGLSLDCLWTVSGLSLDCLWDVSELSLTVSQLSLVCLWILSGLSDLLDISLLWLYFT